MSTPAEREKMLAEMTRAEKAELLRWIVRDLSDDFPGIESKPDVMGWRAVHYSHTDTRVAAGTSAPPRHK